MIRRLLALFAAPSSSEGAAPAPVLRPAPYSSAWHQRRAHRTSVAVHMSYGRFLVGRTDASAEEIADVAEQAAEEWLRFAIALRAESVTVPDSPEGLLGGGQS